MTTTHKQYVNLNRNNPAELGSLDPLRAGPTTTVRAKIDKKKAGVTIVFELTLGPNNTIQTLDPSDAAYRAALAAGQTVPGLGAPGKVKSEAMTDANGEATMPLLLTCQGGDELTVRAYQKQTPSDYKEVKYETWRRIFVEPHRHGFANGSSDVKALDLGPVADELKAKRRNIELVFAAEVQVDGEHTTELPPEKDYSAVTLQSIVSNAKSRAKAVMKDRDEVTILVLHIAALTERVDARAQIFPDLDVPSASADLAPNLGLRLGEITCRWSDAAPDQVWKVPPAYAALGSNWRLTIELPAHLQARWLGLPGALPRAGKGAGKLVVEVRYTHESPMSVGGLRGANVVWECAFGRKGERKAEDRVATATHEIGHALGLVPKEQVSTWYEEHGAKGHHCKTGVSDTAAAKYTGGTCAMFGIENPSNKAFCDACGATLRTSTMRLSTVIQ